MNNRNATELALVIILVSFVIYMDHGTFLGGMGDILALFTIIYTWLSLVRNERLENIEKVLRFGMRRQQTTKGGKTSCKRH